MNMKTLRTQLQSRTRQVIKKQIFLHFKKGNLIDIFPQKHASQSLISRLKHHVTLM